MTNGATRDASFARTFLDSLLKLPEGRLNTLERIESWLRDQPMAGAEEAAECLVALFLVLAVDEHVEPGTLRRFAEQHSDPPTPAAGAQPHRETPVPGMRNVTADEGVANLVGYLNAVGARTHYSCQGDVHTDTGKTVISVRPAAERQTAVEFVTSCTAEYVTNLVEGTTLGDLLKTRRLIVDVYDDTQRAVSAAGYLMFDTPDGGGVAHRALRALATRAGIEDRRITSVLEGDHLRHMPGPIPPDVWVCVVLVEGLAGARYDFAEDAPFGKRITIHVPAETVARLDLAAKELLGELPPAATARQATPAPTIPYPAAARRHSGTGANGRLEEELTQRCPGARIRPHTGRVEGFTIDVPSGTNPEPVWEALRASAERAELKAAEVLQFLHGSGPLWDPYTGNGLAVEVEYSLSLSRNDCWQRTITVRQHRHEGEATDGSFPDIVRIKILDRETARALLSP
jgi:hypothetical protein